MLRERFPKVDAVFSSDLLRAVQTAELVAAAYQLQVRPSAALLEPACRLSRHHLVPGCICAMMLWCLTLVLVCCAGAAAQGLARAQHGHAAGGRFLSTANGELPLPGSSMPCLQQPFAPRPSGVCLSAQHSTHPWPGSPGLQLSGPYYTHTYKHIYTYKHVHI